MSDEKLLQEMGLRVSRRRKELGLTQEQVAEQMDVSIQMISNLELGRKAIRPENLIKICSVLSTSADYLLTGKHNESEFLDLAHKIAKLPQKHQSIIIELVDCLADHKN